MNGFHPAITAALIVEHRLDLVRSADTARLLADATDTADGTRHTTPAQRPAWWSRVTAPLLVTRTLHSGA